MEQYRGENLKGPVDYSKKIIDVEPIQSHSVQLTRKTLEDFVEEPCLDACRQLYDLNIQTYMSSANKQNVGNSAWISIFFDSLSEENKKIIDMMKNNNNGSYITKEEPDFGSKDNPNVKCIITINVPVNEETTVGEVREIFLRTISSLKLQDVLYGRYSREEVIEEIRKTWGVQGMEVDDELIKEMGYYYSKDDGIYFHGEELLKKHLEYKEKERKTGVEI